MYKILALFTLAIAVIIGLFAGPSIQQRLDDSNAYRRESDLLRLQEQQLDLDRYRATQASRIVSDYGFGLLLLVGGAGLLVIGVDGYRRRAVPLVRFYGQPVARAAIERGELVDLLAEALRLNGIAQIAQAQQALPPHTYSPHLIIRGDTAPALAAAPIAALASVPTFAELLNRGRVGKGNPLILGFDVATGAELAGSWLDLYSTVVSGLPGTGKTTTQRFLACQTVLQGARFAIIDPHAGAADDSLAATLQPLASAFVCEPASDDRAILSVVRYVADVGQRRISGKDKDTTPLILWADELTSLLARSTIGDELAALLERVAQEYRKRFVFVCGSGQIFTAARATSELRDSFASAIVHRMRRGQARLLLPTEEAQQVERLATGNAVLWRTSGATSTISVPNTTANDVRQVAALLTDNQPTIVIPSVMNQSRVSQAGASDYSAVERREAPTADAARVLSLFLAGKDAGQVVTEIWGMSSKAGAPYMRKLAEVQAVIRQALAAT